MTDASDKSEGFEEGSHRSTIVFFSISNFQMSGKLHIKANLASILKFPILTSAPGKEGLQVAQRRRVEGGKHDQNWLRRGGVVFHFNTSAFGTMGGRRVSGSGGRGDLGCIEGRQGGHEGDRRG